MDSLIWFLVVASAIWVAIDSSRLGAHRGRLGGGPTDFGPVSWFFVVLVVWLIGFTAYLITRPRLVEAQRREAGAWVPQHMPARPPYGHTQPYGQTPHQYPGAQPAPYGAPGSSSPWTHPGAGQAIQPIPAVQPVAPYSYYQQPHPQAGAQPSFQPSFTQPADQFQQPSPFEQPHQFEQPSQFQPYNPHPQDQSFFQPESPGRPARQPQPLPPPQPQLRPLNAIPPLDATRPPGAPRIVYPSQD